MGGSYQQEVDLHSLFRDVAALPGRGHRAGTAAERTRPRDADGAGRPRARRADHPVRRAGAGLHRAQARVQAGPVQPAVPPSADRVARGRRGRRAAEVLNAGSKVAILVGQGARGAAAEVVRSPTLLGAGVAKALLGKDVLPDDLPYVTGSIGLLGTRPSYEMMRDCDTLLIVGSNFPYSQFLPPYGKARGVQIDIDGRLIGMRYPTEVNLVGDAAGDAAVADPAAASARRPVVALDDREERRALVGHRRTPGAGGRRPGQPDAARAGAVQTPARQRDRHRGLRLATNWYARELRIRGEGARARCPARWRRWDLASRTRSAPSSPTRTGR